MNLIVKHDNMFVYMLNLLHLFLMYLLLLLCIHLHLLFFHLDSFLLVLLHLRFQL